ELVDADVRDAIDRIYVPIPFGRAIFGEALLPPAQHRAQLNDVALEGHGDQVLGALALHAECDLGGRRAGYAVHRVVEAPAHGRFAINLSDDVLGFHATKVSRRAFDRIHDDDVLRVV